MTLLLERIALELGSPKFIQERMAEDLDDATRWSLEVVSAMLEDPAKLRSPGPLVLLIDGVDDFNDGASPVSVEVLPHRFPGRLTVVYTCEDGEGTDAKLRASEQPSQDFKLAPLAKRWLSRIAESRFEVYNKKLDRQQLDLLLANPGATNLRWLVLACEELRVHGAYETVTDAVTQLGDTVEKLTTQVLTRQLATDASGLVRGALSLLCVCVSGLTEEELCALLGRLRRPDRPEPIPYAEWSLVYSQISVFLRAIGMNRVSLLSVQVHEIVERLLGGDNTADDGLGARKQNQGPLRQYRRCLADHFDTVDDLNRRVEEVPAQLKALNDRGKLLAFMRSEAFQVAPYRVRHGTISFLRCSFMVFPNEEATAEVLCASCAAKHTFNPRRPNRMSCFMCGNPTFSGLHAMPGQTPNLMHGEEFAVKCRKHRGHGGSMARCMQCTHMVDKRFGVPALCCRTCALVYRRRCCVLE